jgi:DNA polymerase III alpha subunit
MKMTELNEVVLTENDLVEGLLQGKKPKYVVTHDTEKLDTYNHFCTLFKFDDHIDYETPASTSDKYSYENVENWWMPEEYKTLDIEQWLYIRVSEELQIAPSDFVYNSEKWMRVEQELEEFDKRGFIPVLKFLVYMIDQLRTNNIMWGVGRGSSVSSYVLYLIGVHRIDSVKYNLDYKEFLR